MKYYKIIIRKYSIFCNDFITYVYFISTNDLYHFIGYLYCTSIVEIKRVDYQEISFDYYKKNKEVKYYYFNGEKHFV